MSTRPPTRRSLLRGGAAVAAGLVGCRLTGTDTSPRLQLGVLGLGPLVPDPDGVLDLPDGFAYRVLSRAGEEMDDGLLVPPRHDGMATFEGPKGLCVLVRNHENAFVGPGAFGVAHARLDGFPAEFLYDAGAAAGPPRGGTTTVVYDTRRREVVRHFLSLAGTSTNCAGGPTPWGSWLSCEETTQRAGAEAQRDHGYVFEVPALAVGPARPEPLVALGRFRHEAVAVDELSGALYLTEDIEDGLLYRFLPNRPGALREGGRLQALAVADAASLDTRNWDRPATVLTGERLSVHWVDLDEPEAPLDDLRHRGFAAGAARFARGEGIWAAPDGVYFTCTSGGRARVGQIWRYVPGEHEGSEKPGEPSGTLELFLEPNDPSALDMCDNLAGSPWGDLVVCEDGGGSDRIVGLTPAGDLYPIARNAAGPGEFAGVCFSPDGSTMFVNAQEQGTTLAITGPWERARRT